MGLTLLDFSNALQNPHYTHDKTGTKWMKKKKTSQHNSETKHTSTGKRNQAASSAALLFYCMLSYIYLIGITLLTRNNPSQGKGVQLMYHDISYSLKLCCSRCNIPWQFFSQ